MEKELAKMRAGLDESVQLMEQREMNTNIEYATLFPSVPNRNTNKLTALLDSNS